jgi:hypothetical protein
MSDAEVVKSGMDVRNKWRDMREGRMHMKEVFEELLGESKANAGMDQEDEPEGTAIQLDQVRFLGSLTAFLSDSCFLVIWEIEYYRSRGPREDLVAGANKLDDI